MSFDLDEEDAGCPSCSSHKSEDGEITKTNLVPPPHARQKVPKPVPVARPRTHILIPFAGEATERGTSNENQQRRCGVQTAKGTILRL
jgi:hypothetical protein